MSLPALSLLLAVTLLVGLYVFGARWRLRLLLWAITLGVSGWQLSSEPHSISVIPVYLLLVVLAFATLIGRLVRWRATVGARTRLWPRLLLMLIALPLLAIPIIEALVIPFDPEDYSRESWTQAFEKLHATLEERYAFGDWKAVGWVELHERHRDEIALAEQADDEQAYYLALRNYVYDLPDGHVSIRSKHHDELETSAIGGGFGIALLTLDGGEVIAHIVEQEGPAAHAGVNWGAEILEWNRRPIEEAIAKVPVVWASRPMAIAQNRVLAQQQLLPRAAEGTEIELTFRNREDATPTTAVLTARVDGLDTYWKSVTADVRPPAQEPVSFELLDDEIGYIRVASLETSSEGLSPPEAMNVAMQELVRQGMRALILDVRGNRGGMDQFVPKMMGYFTSEPIYYEGVTTYNKLLGRFTQLLSLEVQPKDPQFEGSVVVLVDHRTKSSGEGFGLLAKSLSEVDVMGFHGTDGSFGMAEATVHMPAGITVAFPWGQSLDQHGAVQVEGNHALEGGVAPDIKVPMTLERASGLYVEGVDVLRDRAAEHLQHRIEEPIDTP